MSTRLDGIRLSFRPFTCVRPLLLNAYAHLSRDKKHTFSAHASSMRTMYYCKSFNQYREYYERGSRNYAVQAG